MQKQKTRPGLVPEDPTRVSETREGSGIRQGRSRELKADDELPDNGRLNPARRSGNQHLRPGLCERQAAARLSCEGYDEVTNAIT